MGTNINIPVRQGTNGSQRLYINNTAGGVLGSVGIGNLFSAGFIPRSMLHIAQDNGIATIGGGLRNWMQPTANGTFGGGTGMLMSNGDNVWLGLRNKGGTWNANDAILDWGDNGGPGTDFF